MDSDLSKFIELLWRYKPMLIILVVAGILIFMFCVIDTYRHRKTIRKKRPQHKNH